MNTYVVTGVTGQVAESVATHLAPDHRVIGVARFGDADARRRLEDLGVECVALDLTSGDLSALPMSGVDVVANFAVTKTQRWDVDLVANADAAGLLMAHVRPGAFFHCSSTGVYDPAGSTVLDEAAPLGDNHRAIMPTYSITKIAGERVVATMCRHLGIPTTIARLNVPYGVGPDGTARGWPAFHLAMIEAGMEIPVHPDRPNLFNPIELSDIARTVPALVDAASVPATIVNWAGEEQVDLEDWCRLLAERIGREARFAETDATIGGVTVDTTRMRELCGPTQVTWRDGFARLADAYTSG